MTILPLRVVTAEVEWEIGELQDLLGSASLVSGNGPSHGILYRGLQQTRQGESVGSSHMGVAYACLACQPPAVAVSEKMAIWAAERRAGRKTVEFFGTHL